MEQNKKTELSKLDYGVSISSGAITGLVDVFFVKEISLANVHKWGKDKTEKFVDVVDTIIERDKY